MINFPVSPGNNPVRVGRPEVTDWTIRDAWGDSISVPVSQYDFTDPNSAVDPANAGHTALIKNLDPRHNLGKANPRNPYSANHNNSNPAMDPRSLDNSFLQ